jgi:uncharacterized protein YrzB (UPF0473 family)
MMEEENLDIVLLEDEDGNELKFVWEMSIEYKGETYCILCPAEEIEGFEAETAVIFRLDGDEDAPMLLAVEDSEIADAVYQEYINI